MLELGISELGNCLQAKGAPDACISFFKTGNGKEACIEGRMNRMMDHINQNRKWAPNWNTCFEEDILLFEIVEFHYKIIYVNQIASNLIGMHSITSSIFCNVMFYLSNKFFLTNIAYQNNLK